MIDETPLFEFQDVQIEVREGRWGDAPLNLYPGTVFEDQMTVLLTAAASWQQRTFADPADEISIDVTFPQGLGRFDLQTGRLGEYQVVLEAEYRTSPSGPWVPLDSTIAGQTFHATPAPQPLGVAVPFEHKGRVGLTFAGRLEMREGQAGAVGQTQYPSISGMLPLYRFTVGIAVVTVPVHVGVSNFELPPVTEGYERYVRLAVATSGSTAGQVTMYAGDPGPIGTAPVPSVGSGTPLWQFRVIWDDVGVNVHEMPATTFWPPFAGPTQGVLVEFLYFRITLNQTTQQYRLAVTAQRRVFPDQPPTFPLPNLEDFPTSYWSPVAADEHPLYRGAMISNAVYQGHLIDERTLHTTGFDVVSVGPGAQIVLSGGQWEDILYTSVIDPAWVDQRGGGVTGFFVNFAAGLNVQLTEGTYPSTGPASTITEWIDERDPAVSGFDATLSGLQITIGQGVMPSSDLIFVGAQANVLRRTITRVVPRTLYDIRVRRVTGDTSDTAIVDEVFWTAIRAFRWETPIQFGPRLCVIALRIRASSQLSGSLGRFSVIVTAADTPYSTRNPASAFRLALQGPASAKPLADSELDLPALAAWASYCDLKGFTFDMPRDFRAGVWETVQDACSAGRARLTKTLEGKWSVVVDEQQSYGAVVQHFSERNSWDYSCDGVFQDLPHAYRMRYLNELENWNQDEVLVYRDGYSASNATLFEQREVPGVTHPSLVWRHGRFHFAQAILQPQIHRFMVDWEYLACAVGSRVAFSRQAIFVGLGSGRVTTVDYNTGYVGVDETLAMEADTTYAVRFRASTGQSFLDTVETVPGETQLLHVTGGQGMPVVGDLFFFGESGLETVRLTVKAIEPGTGWTARLTCVDEAPEIHSADVGPIPPYDPHITIPPDFRTLQPPKPVFLGVESSGLQTYVYQANGTLARSIVVSLGPSAPPEVGPGISHYELGYTLDFADWRTAMVDLRGWTSIVPVTQGQTWYLYARSISVYGIPSGWVEAIHTVGPSGLIPGPLRNVRVYGRGQTLFIEFEPPIEGVFGVASAQARLSLTPNFADGTTVNLGYTTSAQLGPYDPATVGWVWVNAVSVFGDQGPWTPVETGPGLLAVIGGMASTGTQWPALVRGGTFLGESLIAATIPLESANLVEYVTPQGLMWVTLEAGVAMLVQARQQHPQGAVIGSASMVNNTSGTVTTPVSLMGLDDGVDWNSAYCLTAIAVDSGGTVTPLTVLPDSTFAIVHTPVVATSGITTLESSITPGPKSVETVISTSPTITVSVSEGVIEPRAWLNLTIAANSTVIARVRQTNATGEVVGAGHFANPLSSPLSMRLDVNGLDLTPLYGGVYVLTIVSYDAAGVVNTVTVDAGGGMKIIHRNTNTTDPDCGVTVLPGTMVIDGAKLGTYAASANLATFPPLATAPQTGHVTVGGLITIGLPSQSIFRLEVRRETPNWALVGSYVVTNPSSVELIAPLSVRAYDANPLWGGNYAIFGLCVNDNQVPVNFTLHPGGTCALLHAERP
jgi:hypothetical protein